MGLEEGVDYARSVDIAEHFRVWNPKFGNWLYFSLARLAFGLLGQSIQDGVHSSVEDANVSMALFRVRSPGNRLFGVVDDVHRSCQKRPTYTKRYVEKAPGSNTRSGFMAGEHANPHDD